MPSVSEVITFSPQSGSVISGYLQRLIALRTTLKVQLKRTGGPKGGRAAGTTRFTSRTIFMMAGGGVGCLLLVALLLNSWSAVTFQDAVNSENTLPSVSGSLPAESSAPQNQVSQTPDSEELTPEIDGSSQIQGGNMTSEEPEVQISFTDGNFLLLSSDPDRFANSSASISGRVYEVVYQSTGGYVLMTYRIHNQAIDSDESRAVILFQEARLAKAVPPQVDVDDCIYVEGRVRGGIGDTNSLGQPIRIPIIDTSSVSEIECIDSAMPASVTGSSKLTQSYGGITVTAERIQISDGHLRVKVTAQNYEASDTVFIRDRESYAEHLGSEHRSIGHLPLFSTYRLDSTLTPESEISGYMFFEPIPEYSGGPIVFKIVVEKVGISENEKTTFILKL